MSRRSILWLLGLLLAVSVPTALWAQTGTIAGKVVDATTGDPLPGANVLVQGLEVGAATNVDGEFTIANVPAGQRSVIARFIGYKSQIKTVMVSGGSVAELNFELSETVLELDEVVVTGAGVASEKKKLGNTVATINARLIEDAPVTSFSEMIAAREAGVSVLPSGGLAGEGARIRIRGTASLSQTNEPIVYIDGIRVDNSGGFAGVYAGGGGSPSRLDDINPDAIERVEILKGAAAATLYGTQASNGIIQIFTKRGSFGKPRFTLEIEQAAVTYPDRYKPNTGFARTEEQAARMSEVFGQTIRPWQLVQRTNVKDLFTIGYGQTYSMSVSGGGSGVTYFLSGRFHQLDGPYGPEPEDFLGKEPGGSNDFVRRAQFQGNINVTPSPKLNFRVSTWYSNVHQEVPDNNNNIYGVISQAMFGKPEWASLNNPQGTRAFMTVREGTYQETKDNTDHAGISITTNYKFSDELTVEGVFGVDYVSQRSSTFRPFGWNVDGKTGATVDGALTIGKRDKKEWTVDIKANWNRNFGSDISSQLVVGFQGFNTVTNFSAGDGVRFPGPGLEVLGATEDQTAWSSFSEVINAGWFLQEQLGYKDYAFLTAGIRFDANSAFGSEFKTQSYPKIGLSFVPTTAFDMSGTPLSTLRLRAAVGQSGQQPGAFDQFTTFVPFTSSDGSGLAPGNLGNPKLKPEVSTEWEVGFEAGLLQDRLGLEFTYWDRTVKDALIARQFPLSGGFRRLQLDNIGQIDASGIDISGRFSVMRKENLSIDIFANGAYLKEKITDLGGAPPLKVGGAYPRYRNFLEEGYAPGAHLGAKLNRDLDYPIDINGDGQADSREDLLAFFSEPRDPNKFRPVLLDEDGDGDLLDNFLGKPTPDWQGSFGLNVTFLKRFRLSSLFEYKAGNYYVNNLTDAFRKSHPFIGRNTPQAAATELVLLNPESTAEQRLEAANRWVREFLALAPYSGLNTIEKADFIRWRELSLAYDVPRYIAANFGVRTATITLAARNLALFTGYSGVDPETNAIGRGAQGGINGSFLDSVEAFGLPIPRQIVFKLRVGF